MTEVVESYQQLLSVANDAIDGLRRRHEEFQREIYERDQEIHYLLMLIEDVRRIAEHTGRETGPGTSECDGDECIACVVRQDVVA